MRNLKLGVAACGLLGIIGCFLPMMSGISFFDMRAIDGAHVYITLVAFGASLAMGVLGVQKGMQRWMSVIAIVGFSVVILRMRGEMIELMKAGIGGKLMGAAALAGLALAILTTVKPEPAR